VDAVIDEMLLERLHAATNDEALWQTSLARLENMNQADLCPKSSYQKSAVKSLPSGMGI